MIWSQMKMMPLLAALAMSVGWGWRGDYGHEAGAMVPGALLGLAIALTSGREDWVKRASLFAFLGAIGWAFGGQMSYGIVIGYTAHSSFPDVLYGYACLFVIGALWGAIGAGILALAITEPRSALEQFVGPLVCFYLVLTGLNLSGVTERLSGRWALHDSDWVIATAALLVAVIYGFLRPSARKACTFIAVLAGGWWLGLIIFALLLNLRMTPPRSDNWAGCVGLWIALMLYHYRTQNRIALQLSLVGLLAGGIGFAVADWVNMAGRAKWGLIGSSETLRALDSWKWMEQLFGLIMGLGVAIGFSRIAKHSVSPEEDQVPGRLRAVALWFLLIVMPWENLHKNVQTWTEGNYLAEGLFGFSPQQWIFLVAVLLSLLIALVIWQYHQNGLPMISTDAFGRAQMLFLLVLWIALVADFTRALPGMKSKGVLFVHLTFWLTALACTFIVLRLRQDATITIQSESLTWQLNWKFGLSWALIPLLIFVLARLSVRMHTEPLPGSHLRFAAVGSTSPN